MIEPTSEEVRGWLDQSVGKYFKEVLNEKMQELKDNWASGYFTDADSEATIQLNSEALGKVQQLADIMLTLDELSTDEEIEDEGSEEM